MTKLIKFNKREINVKQHYRKGKIVKASKRKIDKKKLAIKSAIATSSILGIAATSYLVLKKRYNNNLKKFADNLKPNNKLGKTLDDSIKSITFTIGGMGEKGNDTTIKQSKALMTSVKKGLTLSQRKQHHFIPLEHNMITNERGNSLTNSLGKNLNSVRKLANAIKTPFLKGYNADSFKIAEEIYNYSLKNPGKDINLIGYSVGGNISKDVVAILKEKNININLVTLGTANFNIVNNSNIKSINIMGDNDFLSPLKHSKSIIMNGINTHRLDGYLMKDGKENKELNNVINNFLFN